MGCIRSKPSSLVGREARRFENYSSPVKKGSRVRTSQVLDNICLH
jgi:hypothetical protein